MHSFFIFGAVLHTTALAVIAFFVFFAAARSEGRLATFGNLLGVWLLILALIALVFGAVMLSNGGRMLGGYGYGYNMMGGGMMGGNGPGWGWMHNGQQPGWMNGTGQPQPPATTTP